MMETCSCENVERMLEAMAAHRDEMPESIRLCYDLLASAGNHGKNSCCAMVMWLYYAFFCENTHSVSEEARHILVPLIEGRIISDQEEREWEEGGKPKE